MDNLSKLVDSYYKKLLILLAIDGGVWVYGVKFIEKYFFFSFLLFFIFLFISYIIIINYVKMNQKIKQMEEMNERNS